MNQLILGASIPYVAAAVIYLARRARGTLRFFIVVPIAMAVGAVYAVIPDIPRLFGFQDLYFRLARSPWTDVFLWHYSIDKVEKGSPWFLALAVIMGVSLLAAALRELLQLEAGHLPRSAKGERS